MKFDQSVCSDLSQARRKEWLETNGIGGFASSTITGMNTRRYHGLLVAATRPPVGRMVLLGKFEERLHIGDAVYDLSTNQYPGAIHPNGYSYLSEFRMDPLPALVRHKICQAWKRITFSQHGVKMTHEAGLDCYYVPHGVETALFHPGDRQEARKLLGLPADKFVVVPYESPAHRLVNRFKVIDAIIVLARAQDSRLLVPDARPIATKVPAIGRDFSEPPAVHALILSAWRQDRSSPAAGVEEAPAPRPDRMSTGRESAGRYAPHRPRVLPYRFRCSLRRTRRR